MSLGVPVPRRSLVNRLPRLSWFVSSAVIGYPPAMRSTSKMLAGAAIALSVVAGGYSLLRPRGSDAKTLVGRLWIDRLPKNDAEHLEFLVLLPDEPLGVFERRSRFEGSFAMFRYELRGDNRVQLLFPQDASKHEVRYDARACDARGFDFCLDLNGAPRGAGAYFSRKEWKIEARDPAALEAELDAFIKQLPASEPGS
jgi:hypothetical protein